MAERPAKRQRTEMERVDGFRSPNEGVEYIDVGWTVCPVPFSWVHAPELFVKAECGFEILEAALEPFKAEVMRSPCLIPQLNQLVWDYTYELDDLRKSFSTARDVVAEHDICVVFTDLKRNPRFTFPMMLVLMSMKLGLLVKVSGITMSGKDLRNYLAKSMRDRFLDKAAGLSIIEVDSLMLNYGKQLGNRERGALGM